MLHAKQRLGIIWLTGAGVLFALVFAQTLLGKYGDHAEDAWAWLMPAIMPTASLIVGVLVSDLAGAARKPVYVSRFVFKLSAGLSVLYLSALLVTLLAMPLSELKPMELLTTANLGLAPLQGLVTAALGAFFVSKQKQSASDEPQPA